MRVAASFSNFDDVVSPVPTEETPWFPPKANLLPDRLIFFEKSSIQKRRCGNYSNFSRRNFLALNPLVLSILVPPCALARVSEFDEMTLLSWSVIKTRLRPFITSHHIVKPGMKFRRDFLLPSISLMCLPPCARLPCCHSHFGPSDGRPT